MFNTFRNRKSGTSVVAKLLERGSSLARKRLQHAALWLQVRSRRKSKRQLVVLLVLFCLVFGGSSLWVIYSSCRGAPGFAIQPISVPKHVTDSGQCRLRDGFDAHAWASVEAFQAYVDSIKNVNPAGFDSIQKERKGLFDSIKALEFYLQEPKKTREHGK